MSFIDKVSIPVATEHRSNLDLSSDHLTTQDVNTLRPIYFNEFLPNSSIKIDVSQMTRLMPMLRPTYGSVKMRSLAFFVPLRTVFHTFDEFYTDTQSVLDTGSAIVNEVPTVSNKVLCNLFISDSAALADVTSNTAYDFCIGAGSTYKKYVLTAKGRNVKATLESLGYQINFSGADLSDETEMSALPIFAYYKCIQDWLVATQYQTFNVVDTWIKSYSSGGQVTVTCLKELIALDVVYRKADYYNSAWLNPTSPSQSNNSQVALYDPSLKLSSSVAEFQPMISSGVGSGGTSPLVPNTDTPFIGTSNNANTSVFPAITQYAITALQAMSDYMRRHQLSGYRALDRFMAQYGIKLPAESMKRTKYLGSWDVDINVADVMSNNGGEADTFGDFCGRGYGVGKNGSFSFKTEEFGYFIIINTIVPQMNVTSGRKRWLFHRNRLDFWNPEFDGLAVQAMRKDEVMSAYSGQAATMNGTQAASVFGYTPAYSEYCVGFNMMSGQFTNRTTRDFFKSFHLNRIFDESYLPSLNLEFVRAYPKDLDRIFNSAASVGDHFISIYHFDVHVNAPKKPLYDNYHYGEAGRELTHQINGTRLNA